MKQKLACSLSLRVVFWTTGILALVTGAGRPAQASPIDFQVNNNAGLAEPFSQDPVSITGQFSYDPATQLFSKFQVTLTTTLDFSGTYTDNGTLALLPILGQPTIIFAGSGDQGSFSSINLYLNDFGAGPAYDIRFIGVFGNPDYTLLPLDAEHRPTITTGLGAGSPIPEPSTQVFAFIGAALMLTSLRRRRGWAK
jgi:hypothetical protein